MSFYNIEFNHANYPPYVGPALKAHITKVLNYPSSQKPLKQQREGYIRHITKILLLKSKAK